MNDQLKKQGWSQMKDILDEHMPVKKNKNRIPVWFFILIPVSFTIGYVVNDQFSTTKKNKTPHSVSQYAEIPDQKSVHAEPSENVAISTSYLTSEAQTNIPDGTPKFSKLTSPGTSDHKMVSEQPKSDKTSLSEYNPDHLTQITDLVKKTTFETKTLATASTPISKNDLLPSVDKQISDLYFVKSQQTSEISLPLPVTVTKHGKLRHAVTLSLGTNPLIKKSTSYGISYHLGYSFGKWSLSASLGYRYSDFSFSQNIDSLSWRNNFQTSKASSVFVLDQMHQIIPGLTMSYDLTKKLGMTAGVDFPFLLISQKQTSKVFALEENTLDAGNSPAQEPQYLIRAQSSNYIQKTDIQATLGLMYHLSENIKIAGVYRQGFLPVNKISFMDGNDLKWSQISLDMTYIF